VTAVRDHGEKGEANGFYAASLKAFQDPVLEDSELLPDWRRRTPNSEHTASALVSSNFTQNQLCTIFTEIIDY
jgi:hypothetical protein